MESVYLETTFISYLVSRPSRDLVAAAHQQITHEWWETRRDKFECYVSPVVIREAGRGDAEQVRKRLEILAALPLLELDDEAEELGAAIMATNIMPPDAFPDASHIAVATRHGIDFLVTWNCTHLANGELMRRVASVCERQGYAMPLICTPEELMGEQHDVAGPDCP